MSEFTPGPWHTVNNSRGVRSATRSICTLTPTTRLENVATVQANARLIAAAPELYEALCEALEIIRSVNAPPAWKIQAAIDKVEGK